MTKTPQNSTEIAAGPSASPGVHSVIHTRLILCAAWLCGPLALGSGCDAGGTSSDGSSKPPITTRVSTQAPVRLALEDAFPGLPIARPVVMRQPPGERGTFYIAEQTGKIYRVTARDRHADLAIDLGPLIDTNQLATGLLGLDFSPAWQRTHAAYVFYTAPVASAPSGLQTQVTLLRSPDGVHFIMQHPPVLALDLPSGVNIGGQTVFGPDGFLYLGIGDGETGADPERPAEDRRTLLGKVLRIDAHDDGTYSIPASNPFVRDHSIPGARREIYALGFRNPWRFSFDRATSTLWLGDTGEHLYEEVDRILAGGNYGWSQCEGAHAFDPARSEDPTTGPCAAPDSVSPVLEYSHAELGNGAAIIGGFVYRGAAIPALAGSYVFGDFVHGIIWRLVPSAAGQPAKEVILRTSPNVLSSFSEGLDGELYVLQLDGRILKIVAR